MASMDEVLFKLGFLTGAFTKPDVVEFWIKRGVTPAEIAAFKVLLARFHEATYNELAKGVDQ